MVDTCGYMVHYWCPSKMTMDLTETTVECKKNVFFSQSEVLVTFTPKTINHDLDLDQFDNWVVARFVWALLCHTVC